MWRVYNPCITAVLYGHYRLTIPGMHREGRLTGFSQQRNGDFKRNITDMSAGWFSQIHLREWWYNILIYYTDIYIYIHDINITNSIWLPFKYHSPKLRQGNSMQRQEPAQRHAALKSKSSQVARKAQAAPATGALRWRFEKWGSTA